MDLISIFLSQLHGMQVDRVRLKGGEVRVEAHTITAAVSCPGCEKVSSRVHSRYVRRLSDTAISGREVLIELRVRRFWCRNTSCEKKTFAEPLPNLAARYGRRTECAAGLLESVGLAVGGRAGARLAGRFALPVNRMTLIRAVRRIPDPIIATPVVLGVDDFAIRRGHRYATILINMHTHQPVDVLPDRTADTLAAWLRDHPGVEMIYAEGANRGVPGIPQVADRWHLLHNLSSHVDKAVAKHRRCLRQLEPPHQTLAPSPPSAPPTAREINTLARFAEVHKLKQQGLGTHLIARQLGLDPKTVLRYANAASAQELLGPALTGRSSQLDTFKPYLEARIVEGVTATAILLDEITARGYLGCERDPPPLAGRRPRLRAETTAATASAVLTHHHLLDHAARTQTQ